MSKYPKRGDDCEIDCMWVIDGWCDRPEDIKCVFDKRGELVLTHKGRDDLNRPVYENNGKLYVDVDPRKDRKPEICTKNGNDFYGEPDTPVSEGIEITFIPHRDTW